MNIYRVFIYKTFKVSHQDKNCKAKSDQLNPM